MYFDTHAHYDSGAFNADREEILAALPEAGVALIVNPGCEVRSSETAIALAERFPHVWAYYWDASSKEEQKALFIEQLRLALRRDLPVIVHDREAHGDCLDIVRRFPGLRGVFHCYSGSVEMAQELLKRGWYLGFDGPITYKNARKALEVLEICPLDRVLIETDSPYLSPVPMRGKRNDSRNLVYVTEKIAEIKGITPEEAAAITMENGKKLFNI